MSSSHHPSVSTDRGEEEGEPARAGAVSTDGAEEEDEPAHAGAVSTDDGEEIDETAQAGDAFSVWSTSMPPITPPAFNNGDGDSEDL